ncbi:hypothetical protein VTG60DRAFT_6870 [Thermothelomyces hinnuleus]
MKDAIAQDPGLGCGTESPSLGILNHIGLKYDENAPNGVSDEGMLAIGPDSEIRRVQKELSELETEIAAKSSPTTLDDRDEDLPGEEGIVRRKVDVINAWVAYTWRIEPRGPAHSDHRDGERYQ